MGKLRVAVLFGGKSNEHSISVATAAGVLSAIDSSKYDVIPVGITREGVFVPFVGDPATLSLANGLRPVSLKAQPFALPWMDRGNYLSWTQRVIKNLLG